jgi:hypothetical protein
MTHPHERALEAAARAVYNADGPHVDHWDIQHPSRADEFRSLARAAVTAYLEASASGASLPTNDACALPGGVEESRDQFSATGDGWMPIETAPKATYPETEIRILLWGPSFKNMTVIGWWRGTVSGGIWFNSEDEGGIGWGECKPTHWRPLPAPPALAAQEKK